MFLFFLLITGENGVYPKAIIMSHCKVDTDRCPLKVGTKLEFEMQFIAQSNARTVTPHVEAKWKWFVPKVTIDLDDDDKIGCNSITTLDGKPGCPLVKGKLYKYKVNVDIKRIKFTNLNVDVSIYLQGENGIQTCFAFAAAT